MKTLAWSAGYLIQLLRQNVLLWLLPAVVWLAGYQAEQGREILHAVLEEEPYETRWYCYLITSSLSGIFLFIGQKWFSFFHSGKSTRYGDPAEYAGSRQKVEAWHFHEFLQGQRLYFQKLLAAAGLFFPAIFTCFLLSKAEFSFGKTGWLLLIQLGIGSLVMLVSAKKNGFLLVSVRIFLQGIGRGFTHFWFHTLCPIWNSLLPPAFRKPTSEVPSAFPPDSDLAAHSFFELSEAWRGGFVVLSMGSAMLLLVLNQLDAESLNAMGAAAILWLGISLWTCFFMWVLLWQKTTYLPVYLFLFAGLAYALIGGKEYPILLAKEIVQEKPLRIEQILAQRIRENGWEKRIQDVKDGRGEPIPLLIMASDGGGMRSGYWTALQWENIREKWGPETDRHLFACVALSGGSLGAAAYHLARTENLSSKEARIRYRQLFENDLLASQSRAFVSAENLSAFTPFHGGVSSRDQAFERAIRWGLEKSFPDAELRWPLLGKPAFRPLVVFQATEVESGNKTLIANRNVAPSEFTGDRILAGQTGLFSLETAIHLGARVPAFSPPAAIPLPDGEKHFVDGGYYARGVSEICLDLVEAIAKSKYRDFFRPVVVYATNEMDEQNISGFEVWRDPLEAKNQNEISISGDWTGHFHALVGSAAAHENQSKKALSALLREQSKGRLSYLETQLQNGRKSIPMNWFLSRSALNELESRSVASRKFIPNLDLKAAQVSLVAPKNEVKKESLDTVTINRKPEAKRNEISLKTHPHLYYFSKRLKKWRLIKDADFNIRKLKPLRKNQGKK